MKATHKTPWLVKERDLRRYFGRAIDACMSGRVVFVYHNYTQSPKRGLLMLAPYPDLESTLQAARLAFKMGKYREVVLADLRRKRR